AAVYVAREGTPVSGRFPRSRRALTGRAAAVLVLVGAALVVPVAAAPASAASAYLTGTDFCLDQCDDILPPGENGNATLADILASQVLGIHPAHSDDQLSPYADLVSAYTGLIDAQIGQFYNDSSFGVPASQVESSESPRSDVTIVRDKATG